MKLRLTRAAALVLSSSFLALFGSACGNGYSDEDAELYCEQERVGIGETCWTDATTQQCVDCYSECGNDCTRRGACGYECAE